MMTLLVSPTEPLCSPSILASPFRGWPHLSQNWGTTSQPRDFRLKWQFGQGGILQRLAQCSKKNFWQFLHFLALILSATVPQLEQIFKLVPGSFFGAPLRPFFLLPPLPVGFRLAEGSASSTAGEVTSVSRPLFRR